MRTDPAVLTRFTRAARGPTVVVLDEDEDTRLILTVWLGTAGYEVVAGASAREVALALEGRRPALVVSELRGRAVRALSLVDAIGAEPALREAPLVVNTSRVTAGEQAEARAGGSVAFFTKPTDLRSLLRCVQALVAGAGERPGGAGAEGARGQRAHRSPRRLEPGVTA